MFVNVALKSFVSQLREELVLGQVLLRRVSSGFDLRHVADRTKKDEDLRLLSKDQLRGMAERTITGAFRPLRSAPDLQNGWRHFAVGEAGLDDALARIYPGAVADWHAARSPTPPLTDYRTFTNRQTGMYRITQMLSDAQAGRMITACCAREFCLKRRMWTVESLPPDESTAKSVIPCLEPCAILLEFARKTMRIEQEGKMVVELATSELDSLEALLGSVSAPPAVEEERAADFSSPTNPRRLRFLLEKIASVPKPPVVASKE